jgi:hypothetical protein
MLSEREKLNNEPAGGASNIKQLCKKALLKCAQISRPERKIAQISRRGRHSELEQLKAAVKPCEGGTTSDSGRK